MDLNIIREIERELSIKLIKDSDQKVFTYSYSLNSREEIITLKLNSCEIKNLNRIFFHLMELKQLTHLGLSHNQLSDITRLKDFHKLTSLELSHNLLTDINPLKELHQLTILELSFNQLTDITPLKELHQLTRLELSFNQFMDIALLKELHQLTSLRLSNNLFTDITPLKELKQLTNLDLSGNQLTDITPLKELHQLTSLDLSHNHITDVTSLKELHKLTSLILYSNQPTDITPLKELKQLTHLDLSFNQLIGITPLKELNQLTSVALHHNQLTDITQVKDLHQLTSMGLSYNQITDLTPLKKLHQLASLDLSGNQLTDITPLKELHQLTSLELSDNQLTDITPLNELHQLTSLELSGNQLKDIIPVKELQQLISLDLSFNQLTDISSLRNLRKLNILDLRNNPITNLPLWIMEFEMKIKWREKRFLNKDRCIYFYNNPLKDPPIEIAKQGKDAIKRYFEKTKKEGLDYIYESKLIFVGEGSSGKTSLQKRILNEKAPLPREDKCTRGIEITNWQFKNEKEKKHLVHIWDFGGQNVYYPVHRFFITENAVFVLLASTRQTHHNFDYWIPTIYQFGGKSPVILGQTCHEGNRISWNDLGVYMSNPNFNIIKTQVQPYYEINLPEKNEGLNKIKQIIINQITGLPHYGKGVPKSWVPVRNILNEESQKKACISYEEFEKICKQSNPLSFTSSEDITDCLRFLHDVGVVLWYSANEELKNWIILRPEWAMNAVYKIIDDTEIQKKKGNISAKDFERLWNDALYKDKHHILKKMLEIFKIAFPKKHKPLDYIIPARLLSLPSEKKWKDNEPYLRIEYKYEFMPRGLVNQISAELSRYIATEDDVWNNAVNFSLENNMAQCQVEEDFYNRKITIRAKGKDARGLIILVMDALKNIIESYKGVRSEIYVPCSCTKCKTGNKFTTFLYDDLLRWSSNKENARVTCNESGSSLLIEELLYNVGLPNPAKEKKEVFRKISKKLFVSYSKYDEDYLQSFQEHMVTLKGEGLITFDCREIEFGKKWDEDIKRKIEECDILVCLISVKFLNTDYINKIEIPKAIDQNKIIIPIIIKACDWEGSALGKYQAAQRGRIVSLDNNKRLLGEIRENTSAEKDAFWTAIIKEFRKKLF